MCNLKGQRLEIRNNGLELSDIHRPNIDKHMGNSGSSSRRGSEILTMRPTGSTNTECARDELEDSARSSAEMTDGKRDGRERSRSSEALQIELPRSLVFLPLRRGYSLCSLATQTALGPTGVLQPAIMTYRSRNPPALTLTVNPLLVWEPGRRDGHFRIRKTHRISLGGARNPKPRRFKHCPTVCGNRRRHVLCASWNPTPRGATAVYLGRLTRRLVLTLLSRLTSTSSRPRAQTT